ncbi:MAG: DNA sulfur modification protein DndD, partial [Rhizonema sp. PD37]|nr:DNA sulfur modification protein DndD [Rhizonema sp. PD37]
MIFLELVLQNFGPYIGRQVINLDPRENSDRPIILLGGMNGGGKTTLMDAIRLALYGHRAQCSTRGNLSYDNFLKQCVNSHTQPFEKTQIELAFEHIENAQPVKYRIVRTWSKNPKDGKDSLGIFSEEDKTWGIDSLVSIWDEYIENILPLGISNLFLFDGEQVKELAEQEIPPQIVVDAISGLLGLELAERLADDIEILVNRKRKELADTKDLANLEEIEQKLRQEQEQYNVETKVVASLEEKLKEAESQSSKALDKFISEGGKIAGDRSQLEKHKTQKTTEIDSVRAYMCELAADVLPLALIQPLLSQVQNTAEKEIYRQQTKLALDILQEREKRLVEKIAQLDILEEHLDKIKFLIQEENREIELEKVKVESRLMVK